MARHLTAHLDSVFAVAFSPDSHLLATGSRTGTVRLWNPTTRQPIGEPLTGHQVPVLAVAFSPDDALLATGSDDGTIALYERGSLPLPPLSDSFAVQAWSMLFVRAARWPCPRYE
ncbi:WD40 repeat domain-containing protein [Streptomyces albiflavescens]|uniref:WD40 repeat domain-containing protein n=1 Tax=Streptomyces albiflavescens TaxID=1623582 RepID=UPI001E3F7203|nr:hypothetical protein [Streptomyces albiflavescens]